ncbi:MAG TPA: AbrB/MazE/SpoVT family DNA-binding domain-containing protein [Thermodesulfovibrio thiophilus]|nr:AbrB/MazE/SpoVT family DNA-binding domain-containing protein [Thermodesulfovibrio thiophilus]HQD36996.1 AbrB/MazE/SpoVT family DNA-binding domain-containing protein [Thermodesulfovibrio thiophilus]
MEKKVEYWHPNKKISASGGSDFAVFLPAKIMRAMGWDKGETVDLYVTPNEIRLVRKEPVKLT